MIEKMSLQASNDRGGDLEKVIEEVRRPWVGSDYYRNAEKWTFVFWNEGGIFRSLFERLPKGNVIELACGYGRHAEKAAPLVSRLTLVDVIQENLDHCKERLAGFSNVDYKLGRGSDFPSTGSGTVDAIYCYDAMVHFPLEVVEAYLLDTARVLCRGGRALFHHSNYGAGEGKRWAANPHARNFMTKEIFATLSERAGLRVLEQHVIAWGGVEALDCVSLVEKT